MSNPITSFTPSAWFLFLRNIYRKREFPFCSVTYRNLLKLPNSLVLVKFSTLLLLWHAVTPKLSLMFSQKLSTWSIWRTIETTYQYPSNVLFYILSSIWHKPFDVCLFFEPVKYTNHTRQNYVHEKYRIKAIEDIHNIWMTSRIFYIK